MHRSDLLSNGKFTTTSLRSVRQDLYAEDEIVRVLRESSPSPQTPTGPSKPSLKDDNQSIVKKISTLPYQDRSSYLHSKGAAYGESLDEDRLDGPGKERYDSSLEESYRANVLPTVHQSRTGRHSDPDWSSQLYSRELQGHGSFSNITPPRRCKSTYVRSTRFFVDEDVQEDESMLFASPRRNHKTWSERNGEVLHSPLRHRRHSDGYRRHHHQHQQQNFFRHSFSDFDFHFDEDDSEEEDVDDDNRNAAKYPPSKSIGTVAEDDRTKDFDQYLSPQFQDRGKVYRDYLHKNERGVKSEPTSPVDLEDLRSVNRHRNSEERHYGDHRRSNQDTNNHTDQHLMDGDERSHRSNYKQNDGRLGGRGGMYLDDSIGGWRSERKLKPYHNHHSNSSVKRQNSGSQHRQRRRSHDDLSCLLVDELDGPTFGSEHSSSYDSFHDNDNDNGDESTTQRENQQDRQTVDVVPGMSLPLRGAKETMLAIQVDNITSTKCMSCTTRIRCIADVAYVICPECRVVSPVLETGWGLGLGFLKV